MFALLAANWHFYINKFDLICFSVSAYLLHIEYPWYVDEFCNYFIVISLLVY